MMSKYLLWLRWLCMIWPLLPKVFNFILCVIHLLTLQASATAAFFVFPELAIFFICLQLNFLNRILFPLHPVQTLHQSYSLSLNITFSGKLSLIISLPANRLEVPVWCFHTSFVKRFKILTDQLFEVWLSVRLRVPLGQKLSLLLTSASSALNSCLAHNG